MSDDVLTEIIDLLPNIFDKDTDSNIAKLLSPFAEQLEFNRKDLETLSDWQEITSAEGVFLDRIGKQYGELRGSASDEFYRFKILTHILSNAKSTSINDLLRVISFVFTEGMGDITLTNTSSATFKIDNMPANLVGNETEQVLIVQRIEELTAAGVSIEQINFVIATSGLINYSTGISHTSVVNVYERD